MSVGKRKVSIVYRYIPQYRRRFYELLRARLAEESIELGLVYGQPSVDEGLRADEVSLEWATPINNQIIHLGGLQLYWQPCMKHLRGSDLVIVEQANRLLLNYVLLLQQMLGIRRVAFWGHGRNYQSSARNGLREVWKRIQLLRVTWWFAYNDDSERIVTAAGFPAGRITNVRNSIDTRLLVQSADAVSLEDQETVRRELGIKGKNTCVFAGGMYSDKRVSFLLSACDQIRRMVPDFEMLFIGSGIEVSAIESFARSRDWAHYLGPKFDEDKVPYFVISRLQLMPGAVGLSILDSFALRCPLVTCAEGGHGPEFSYLIDGVNGRIVRESANAGAYATAVASLLLDPVTRLRLVEGCAKAAETYSVEDMANRFCDGIVHALEARAAR